MSLIQTIKTRTPSDVINEGLKYVITGSYGTVTNSIILYLDPLHAVLIAGFTISTSVSSPELVTLSFSGTPSNYVFFQGYVQAGAPLVKTYPAGDWYRSGLGNSLLITSTGNITVTIDTRVVSEPAALGYIEQDGSQLPTDLYGRAVMPSDAQPRLGFIVSGDAS